MWEHLGTYTKSFGESRENSANLSKNLSKVWINESYLPDMRAIFPKGKHLLRLFPNGPIDLGSSLLEFLCPNKISLSFTIYPRGLKYSLAAMLHPGSQCIDFHRFRKGCVVWLNHQSVSLRSAIYVVDTKPWAKRSKSWSSLGSAVQVSTKLVPECWLFQYAPCMVYWPFSTYGSQGKCWSAFRGVYGTGFSSRDLIR